MTHTANQPTRAWRMAQDGLNSFEPNYYINISTTSSMHRWESVSWTGKKREEKEMKRDDAVQQTVCTVGNRSAGRGERNEKKKR